jgi:uncharacterized protein (TIGR03083 family)
MSNRDQQTWDWVHHERLRLAALLEPLSLAQWATPSLCAGWTVRDVAAHVISAPTVKPLQVVKEALGLVSKVNKISLEHARELAQRPTAEIVADYRRLDGSRAHPLGTSPADMLIDILVHTQDIAIPLGIDHAMPPEAAAVAAQRACRVAFIFGTWRTIRRLHLEATDTAWSHGRGSHLEGPAGQLLLVCTGRGHVAKHLSGPGASALPA